MGPHNAQMLVRCGLLLRNGGGRRFLQTGPTRPCLPRQVSGGWYGARKCTGSASCLRNPALRGVFTLEKVPVSGGFACFSSDTSSVEGDPSVVGKIGDSDGHVHTSEDAAPKDIEEGGDESSTLPSTLQWLDDLDIDKIASSLQVEEIVEKIEAITPSEALQHVDIDLIAHLMRLCASWNTVKGAELSERLLVFCVEVSDSAEHQPDSTALTDLTPTHNMYSIAITAWAKSGAPGKSCGERSEQLLDLMLDQFERDQSDDNPKRSLSPKPDIIIYSAVMNAWANTRVAEAPHRAEAIVAQMERLSGIDKALSHILKTPALEDQFSTEAQTSVEVPPVSHIMDHSLVPDTQCYGILANAWAQSAAVDSVDRVRKVMRRMEGVATLTGDRNYLPTIIEYSSLVRALRSEAMAQGRTRGKLEKAAMDGEAVIREMYEEFVQRKETLDESTEGDVINSIMPDIRIYNELMISWCKVPVREGVERAEDILLRLLGVDGSNSDDLPIWGDVVEPSHVSFGIVCDGWSNTLDKDAGIRAESLLHYLKDGHYFALDEPEAHHLDYLHEGSPEPTTIILNSVINAWTKARTFNSAERADRILKQMIAMSSDATNPMPNVQPSVVSFGTTIMAWSRSGSVLSGAKAADLLETMSSHHKQIKPNETCYYGVILSWSRRVGDLSSDGTEASAAYRFLRQMREVGRIEPLFKHMWAVQEALAKETIRRNGLDCEEILEQSQSLLRDIQLKYTLSWKTNRRQVTDKEMLDASGTLFSVCGAIAKHKESGAAMIAAATEAYDYLEAKGCHPSGAIYELIFKLLDHWQKSSDSENPERTQVIGLCQRVFLRCCYEGKATEKFLRVSLDILPWERFQRLTGIVRRKDSQDVRFDDLPKSWRSNVASTRLLESESGFRSTKVVPRPKAKEV